MINVRQAGDSRLQIRCRLYDWAEVFRHPFVRPNERFSARRIYLLTRPKLDRADCVNRLPSSDRHETCYEFDRNPQTPACVELMCV